MGSAAAGSLASVSAAVSCALLPNPRFSVRRPVFIPAAPNAARNASHLRCLTPKAADGNEKSSKSGSLVCADCEGNGAILCKECKGTGVNSVDHFNARFKAGGLCWLCRGKREILCGSCNGAGFMGGFMSTLDE